jgi:hypothetical protein
MKMKRGFFSVLLVLVFSVTFGQTGKIIGKVLDASTGETLIGVNIYDVNNITHGTITDLDGNYALEFAPGTYAIKISYISYQPQTIQDVRVSEGAVTKLDIRLDASTVSLDEVVVTAKARRNTETALMTLQKKSAQLLDGISSEQMTNLGDSDAADALKRVTGVSVQEGKYVYVRGLGDRYSKTTLNNAEIPGLDPNKNTVQMDIFPSNVIENIVVHKTFTPDLPGSFTGGHVDIETKDFPDAFNVQFAASLGYNPQTNFNSDVLSYEGGNSDWLGHDDGSRDVPGLMRDFIDNQLNVDGNDILQLGYFTPSEIRPLTESFNTNVETTTKTPFLNQNYEFGLGNQIKLFGNPFGYNVALSYSSVSNSYDDGSSAFFEAKPEPSPLADYQTDIRGDYEAKLAGLVNVNYKFSPNHKIGFTYLRNQAGKKITRFRSGPFPYESPNHRADVTELGYIERAFDSYQITGGHAFKKLNNLKLDWLSSYTISKQNEPDLRIFNSLSVDDETPFIKTNNGPTRTFRFMKETNIDNKIDFTLPFDLMGNSARFKFGGAYVYKNRDRDQIGFEVSPNGVIQIPNGFAEYLQNNMIDPNTGEGYYYIVDKKDDLSNSYKGISNVAAGYAMFDIPFGEKWRFVFGARYEYSDIDVHKKIFDENPDLTDTTGMELQENDILPSLNVTYHVTEEMNIRLGATRTLARPVFQEVSSSQFYDYQDGIRKYGNPDLKRSLITNLDLRWEYFYDLGEKISAGVFYKKFKNPIAQRYVPVAVNPEIEYFNSNDATAIGAEVEFATKLDFVDFLKYFTIGGNFSVIKSEVEKPADEVENINTVRVQNGYDAYESTRPMFGQAPYIINAFLKYENPDSRLDANVGFNMAGEKLIIITKGYAPYVYEQPRASLNFNVSKGLGAHFSVKFSASNLLDAAYKAVHHYDYLNNSSEGDYSYYSYKLGRTFALGLKYYIN